MDRCFDEIQLPWYRNTLFDFWYRFDGCGMINRGNVIRCDIWGGIIWNGEYFNDIGYGQWDMFRSPPCVSSVITLFQERWV